MNFCGWTRSLFIGASVWLVGVVEAPAEQITPVVFDGDAVPGSSSRLLNFSTPSVALNNSTEYSFAVDFKDVSGANGAFVGRQSGLQTLVQTGQSVPGGLRASNATLVQPSLNNAGSLGTSITASPPENGNIKRDVYLFSPRIGGLEGVIVEGDPAPTVGQLFVRQDFAALNDQSQVAISVGLFGDGVTSDADEAILRWEPSTQAFTEVVRKGDAVPGGNGTFTGDTFQAKDAFAVPRINESGTVAFRASVVGGTQNGAIIARYDNTDGGQLSTVVRRGQSLPSNQTAASFSSPVLNDNGLVGFAASYAGSNAPEGVYLSDGATIQQIARFGLNAPDSGIMFRNFNSKVDLNNAGQMIFESEDALFLGTTSSVRTVAMPGQALPDGTGTIRFGGTNFSLNESGQVAFLAPITVPSDGGADNGLFLDDPNRGLIQVLREGDSLLGSSVLSLGFGGSSLDEYSGLNDRGELAFSFSLADGRRGIAIWSEDFYLPGDYNGDGFISQGDLDLVLLNWGDAVVPPGFNEGALPEGGSFDGLVSQNELDGVLLNWGNGTPPNVNAIPEPGVATLFGLAITGLARRRRGG